ncbi:sigma-54 dependent transcriptional regulator [Desulfonatronospira sp. MSAO_Bac3]|uniref:sigma-54 interaction domain-containing protein n=1 Tax=Desulfonatronospira sp. MSAO_Bac3 TaxID=2293857 RepID=UPI000FF19CA9|nr:sigma-54 dependent transcriptional regulator [Desulfonatronospira sp. MSAO_Bac3]RQD79193.1 MAG: sigma-54-dependent Fis family transcriptional regulator [Desulfonatronospira sp. MSAO_Bac3]
MDQNIFFREATMRICGSLDLQKAMQNTLEFISSYIPADALNIGLIDPEPGVARSVVHISPDDWPESRSTVSMPQNIVSKFTREWESKPGFRILNDISLEEPAVQELIRAFWPEDVSLLRTDLALESRRMGLLLLVAEGKNRYTKEHARIMSSLNKPFSVALANALQYEEAIQLKNMLEDYNRDLRSELSGLSADNRIVGAEFGLRQVMRMVRQVAPLESPVLLQGETGTGKEIFANALHAASLRSDGPFIKVNCGGLPESLVDSELFGHEKGAFTGAISRNRGRFERADKGTIFLDEIGELPLNIQAKLLRVLQQNEIERVGGSRTIPVDVRIISATHRNLEQMVQKGEFREDLWFRLNVFPIMIPPLRQRPQDLPALLDHLISRKCREMKITREIRIPSGTIDRLKKRAWPGNVRELQNLVERTLIQAHADNPDSAVLNLDLAVSGQKSIETNLETSGNTQVLTFEEAAARHIKKALEVARGKITGPGGAAEILGLNPSTLRGKMRKLNISP